MVICTYCLDDTFWAWVKLQKAKITTNVGCFDTNLRRPKASVSQCVSRWPRSRPVKKCWLVSKIWNCTPSHASSWLFLNSDFEGIRHFQTRISPMGLLRMEKPPWLRFLQLKRLKGSAQSPRSSAPQEGKAKARTRSHRRPKSWSPLELASLSPCFYQRSNGNISDKFWWSMMFVWLMIAGDYTN